MFSWLPGRLFLPWPFWREGRFVLCLSARPHPPLAIDGGFNDVRISAVPLCSSATRRPETRKGNGWLICGPTCQRPPNWSSLGTHQWCLFLMRESRPFILSSGKRGSARGRREGLAWFVRCCAKSSITCACSLVLCDEIAQLIVILNGQCTQVPPRAKTECPFPLREVPGLMVHFYYVGA